MKIFLATGVVLIAAGIGLGQDAAVASILKRCDAAKPTTESLAFYSLDWTPNLAAAKERAAKENRPILLIYITNITAGTDFYAGHC